MSFDTPVLQQVAEQLITMDISAENLRIAELEEKIARAQNVMEATKRRITELRSQISNHRGPKGWMVAAELLEGAAPADAALAAPSPEALENECAALQAGVEEIHRQVTSWHAEISNIRHQANIYLRQIVLPAADEIADRARAAAEALVDCFAALKAINLATTAAKHELDAVDAIVEAAMFKGRLIKPRLAVDVPKEVAAVLRPLGMKGAAIKPALIGKASVR